MENKYLEKLEFNKICQILSSYCSTYLGKETAIQLKPILSKLDLQKAINQTTASSKLLYRIGNLPLAEIPNITEHIKKIESKIFLNITQILDLANILNLSRNLKDYFFETTMDLNEFESLQSLFYNLYTNIGIEEKIFRCIIDENTIADTASPTLNQIRKNIRNKNSEIKNKLNSLLHSKYLQEPIVTSRNGRYVLPVKAEFKNEISGLVHDTSSSGSTLFIEPTSIFNLNNELTELFSKEKIEIEKILENLSSLLFEISNELKNNVTLIGMLDFIFAKGKYSNYLNATEPIITDEKMIDLKNAFHPLLNKETAVKNNIEIGTNYNMLIITGPNTGGKTVVLKTTGLICLMALSGLHIPAAENSKVFFFNNIFADIGDEQDISTSLSTFSSHISNISYILKNATPNSLVLLDELGSGTDPIEGSNLSISILEELSSFQILTIATTHYPEIKKYALTAPNFINASMEFDTQTLSPTYKFLIGVPGTSNAFAISEKLGISHNIIERAKSYISSDNNKIEKLLNSIYEDKKKIETEKIETEKKYKEMLLLSEKMQKENENLIKEKNKILDEAKEKAKHVLQEAKDDVNFLIKEIEKNKNLKDANYARNIINEKLNTTSLKSENIKTSNLKIEDIKVSDLVLIPSISQTGTILEVKDENHIKIQLGLGTMYFKLTDLEHTSSKPENVKDYSKRKEFSVKKITSEINVIGKNVDEACLEIDKFLDDSFLGGLNSVRIVHGKGTGALRNGIHQFLKNHPHVKTFRVGTFGEGEMGVTIVNIK